MSHPSNFRLNELNHGLGKVVRDRPPPFAGAARSALLIRNAFAPSESRKTTPAGWTWCTESCLKDRCLKDPAHPDRVCGWLTDVPERFVAHRIGSRRAGDCPQESRRFFGGGGGGEWGFTDVPEPFRCIVAHRIGSKRAGDCPRKPPPVVFVVGGGGLILYIRVSIQERSCSSCPTPGAGIELEQRSATINRYLMTHCATQL